MTVHTKESPWYESFWERPIGLTKMTLKKVLGRTFASLTSLQTIVTEIEAVLNDRPITYMSSDVSNLEPLTPAHLLYNVILFPFHIPKQMRVRMMTLTMRNPLEQACEPELFNMSKYYNTFNIVGDENI